MGTTPRGRPLCSTSGPVLGPEFTPRWWSGALPALGTGAGCQHDAANLPEAGRQRGCSRGRWGPPHQRLPLPGDRVARRAESWGPAGCPSLLCPHATRGQVTGPEGKMPPSQHTGWGAAGSHAEPPRPRPQRPGLAPRPDSAARPTSPLRLLSPGQAPPCTSVTAGQGHRRVSPAWAPRAVLRGKKGRDRVSSACARPASQEATVDDPPSTCHPTAMSPSERARPLLGCMDVQKLWKSGGRGCRDVPVRRQTTGAA